MKTITITLSDEAALGLSEAASAAQRSEEDVAKQALEGAFRGWGDLSEEDVAAIEDGLADLEAGRAIPHEKVVADIKAKYGW